MRLSTKLVGVCVAASLLVTAPASAKWRDDWHRDHHHHDHDNGAAAGVALGVGLLAITAAIAAKNKQKADERRDADRYGYGDSYGGDAFSPAAQVVCYRGERRCFARGQFSYEWTDSQFAYDPYRRGY